jgi:hypothetical protein
VIWESPQLATSQLFSSGSFSVDAKVNHVAVAAARTLKILADDEVSRSQVAADLDITSGKLDGMMFGLTMTELALCLLFAPDKASPGSLCFDECFVHR